MVESLPIQQEAVVARWYDAIAPYIADPDATRIKPRLTEWTQRIVAFLLAESPEREEAQAIGGALARDVSAKAQVLGKTQEVVAKQLLEDLSAEQVLTLHPRLIELFSELAIGFVRENEEYIRAMRGQFLSTTSHDMRSPLNAIIGFSRVVLKGIDGPLTELQEQDLTAVYEGGQKLLDFVNNVFNIEKIAIGKIEPELKTFDLAELVKQVVAAAQPMIEENSDTLDVHYTGDPSTVHSDPAKIEEMLVNLLAHAARFTRQGTITLTVTRDVVGGTDWVRFQVAHTGLGMTPEQVERFEQAGDPSTLKYGDIGLTVSQRYCRMLGGEMTVESEVNKGSTLTVRLPIEDAANQ